jgi:hypothetical protein
VKLYDFPASGEIKLTDMLELVGVVSLDPALAAQHPEEDMMGVAPLLPPPSLVPRLHVVRFTKLAHNNPLGMRRALDKYTVPLQCDSVCRRKGFRKPRKLTIFDQGCGSAFISSGSRIQQFRLNTDPDPIRIRFRVRIQSGYRALMTKNV